MATSTSSPPASLPIELQTEAQGGSTLLASASSGSQVNGIATQHNAIDALLPSLPNGHTGHQPDQVPDPESSTGDTVMPVTHVESGIKGVASYLDDMQKSTAQDIPALESLSTAAPPGLVVADGSSLNGLGERDGPIDTANVLNVPAPSLSDIAPLSPVNASPANLFLSTTTGPGPADIRTALSLPPEPLLRAAQDQEMADVDPEHEMTTPATTKVAREREDDEEDEPQAKRARTQTPVATPQPLDALQGPSSAQAAQPALDVSINGHASSSSPAPTPATIPAAAEPTSSAPIANGQASAATLSIDFGPMSELQSRILLDGMRNIKKSKSATAFAKPVDAVTLNIPHYYDLIKNPMDLGTMEQKLKSGHYKSVNGYIADFDQMVQNSVTFNGPDHLVTQAAKNVRSIMNAQLKRVPRPGETPQAEVSKKQRKRSLSGTHEKARPPRQSLPARPSVTPAPPPAPEPIYALDHDGMPQIRRHSSIADGRPKREIHKPPPKDLPYTAKPKKKKYQLELRFCQETLDEITRPAYSHTIAAPFLLPVDPVALNIPNYRSVIKKPMDLGTVRDKLNASLYENAKDFEQDVKVIFANCYKFNGKDHPVSKMGADLERAFDEQWAKKSDWVSKHTPASAPQSPEADDSESEEEEEEEEDDGEAERQAQLEAIHGQFAQLSAQLLALQTQPAKKVKSAAPVVSGKKSAKAGKGGSSQRRKSTSVPSGAALPIRSDKKKSKPKDKKSKPITNAQKEEISEKIGLLTTEQMGRAAEIIKTSLRKAGRSDLADRAEDEMEFEIDQIPDEALHELLKLVRKNVPVPGKAEDTDYRPAPTGKGAPAANQGKARKNKPMKGVEQDQQINRIKEQLNSFQERAAALEDSDGVKDEAVSSGDESDSGSESEEE